MNKLIRSVLLGLPKTYEFLYDLKNNHQINYYLRKVHEPDFLALNFLALNLLCPEETEIFLDIGANAGMSALSIFTLKPQAQVISFEPNAINYPYLDRLKAKFNNFQYLPIGLGSEVNTLDFYYPIYNHKHMTTLGSCDRETAAGWLNEKTVYFFDNQKLEIAEIKVEIKTLDSFDLEPNFIKIDVEGAEHSVLLGGAETIRKYRPILLLEGVASGDQVHQLLKKWQYQALKFVNNRFYLDEFQCVNNFFVPQEQMSLVEGYLA